MNGTSDFGLVAYFGVKIGSDHMLTRESSNYGRFEFVSSVESNFNR